MLDDYVDKKMMCIICIDTNTLDSNHFSTTILIFHIYDVNINFNIKEEHKVALETGTEAEFICVAEGRESALLYT